MLKPEPIFRSVAAALAILFVLFAAGLHLMVQFKPGTPCIFEPLKPMLARLLHR